MLFVFVALFVFGAWVLASDDSEVMTSTQPSFEEFVAASLVTQEQPAQDTSKFDHELAMAKLKFDHELELMKMERELTKAKKEVSTYKAVRRKPVEQEIDAETTASVWAEAAGE